LQAVDLSAQFGHQVGGVFVEEVEVTDGLLEIVFIHGAVENPLINGIEILGVSTESLNSSSTDVTKVQEDILDTNNDYKAILYPNPANYEVSIQILDPAIVLHEIFVYNFSGVLSKTYIFPDKNISDIYNLDISTLPTGVYILKLKTNQNTYIDLKLIVKR
ncbi:T9SS type A sorting domain-containing protein, partial [Salegentibacter maritimus]